jgi:large subunit ribosomal protein L9
MNIQVINLKTGKVDNVSEGYARNYLLPKKLAKLATPQDVVQAQQHHQAQARHQVEQSKEWEELARRLPSLTIELTAKTSPNGTLYERVSLSDILSALQAQFQVSLDQAWLKVPSIKQVGSSSVQVNFPNSLTSIIHVKVKAQ